MNMKRIKLISAKQFTAWCIIFSLVFVTIFYSLLSVTDTVIAAGTGGIKGTRLPAGYVTQEQMKLAYPWKDLDEGAVYDVMRKAQDGQKVTIALIGGSITKGTISMGSRDGTFRDKFTYADYFSNWWYKTFPKADLRFVNAGISATDSYLGVHRLQADVLDKKPDLVVVEFAVNDQQTYFHKQTYENLVRTLLDSDSKPAVMLLFLAKANGHTCQIQQAQIGKHYRLPMLSYANVMKDLVSKGIYTMDELTGDAVHPSALGSAVIGEMIVRYLDNIHNKSVGQVIRKKAPKTYVTSRMYKNAQVKSCKNINIKNSGTFAPSQKSRIFPDNLTSKKGSGSLTFTVTCKNLGLLYARQSDGKGGEFDIYVDGRKVTTLDADYPEGRLNNYLTGAVCYSSKVKKSHTIRIVKNKKSAGSELTIFGVLVSG